MAALLKIISAFLCLQLFQVWAHECDRRLMGSSGVVSSYNFPLDNTDQICTYEHRFEGFDDGKVKEICFQFKRFILSGDSFLYIDQEYTGRGSLSMSNLCVPVMNNVFRMVNFVAEPSPGFFATYYVVTEDTNVTTNSKIVSTMNPPNWEENVFCNSTELFQCFDGKKCINSSLQCNQEFDCDDHSDEAYATARCEGVSGQNSPFRAVNVSSVPVELSDYRMSVIRRDTWKVENYSTDPLYGPKKPHVSGYYFRGDFFTAMHELIYELNEDLYKDNISYCLSFWYHLNGKDAGALWIFWGPLFQWPIWQRQGDFKSVWLKGEVQRVPSALDEKVIRVSARGGTEDRIQPAIQDISVMPGPCHNNADYELAGVD